MKQEIIVIGAGIAGLAAAARLARRGHRVTLYEQGAEPGGKIARIEQDGFAWDAGPSFFTDKKEFDRLFRDCGKKPDDYYAVMELDEACRYFFADRKVLYGYDHPKKFALEIERVLNEPAKHTEAFLAQATQIYRRVANQFLDSPFTLKSLANKQAAQTMMTVPLHLLYTSMHAEHARFFRRNETVTLFDRFATYNGSNPYRAPGILSCLPYLEHVEGALYVQGGMHSLTLASARLAAECGVRQVYSTPVKKITHSQNRVTGVITESGWHKADYVVSAIDINYLYKYLVPARKRTVSNYVQRERSLSATVFYWGMNKQFDALSLHNIFFSNDYRVETNRLWQDKLPALDPTVYVNITSKLDPTHAPHQHENWFVMVNTPSRVDTNWREQIRKSVIRRLEATLGERIEPSIVCEQVRDAQYFEATYNALSGALYGAASNSFRGAFLRHPNRSPDYENLLTIGVSTHPGGGIPLALRSARIIDGMLKSQ